MTQNGVERAPLAAGEASRRFGRLWADLSLQMKLLCFALALVTLPGIAFALLAFAGARSALEREIGIQLQQAAERGADAVSATLGQAESDARSWVHLDVMRDLLVGDVDKRVSRFLQAVADSRAGYLQVLCIDRGGTVVAASSGGWVGRTWPDDGNAGEVARGPFRSSDFAPLVFEIVLPIANPDARGTHIGRLVLVHDWTKVASALDELRRKLAALDKQIAALIVDRDGAVIGGVSFDGSPAERSALAAEAWDRSPAAGYGTRRVGSDGSSVELLVGAASVAHPPLGWSVSFAEPASEALAAVQRMRSRWMLTIAAILLAGLALAVLLARQVLRPLAEVTRATSDIAAHPDLERPLLPVRSSDEVGQLTRAFNGMTTELRRSREEALSAAKFAFAGELAALVAHEVRTPLTVMRSSAQMLADPGSRSTHDAELIDTIVAEVDRVERVVTGLIELARPLDQRPTPTRLGEVLTRAAGLAAAHARERGVRIACASDGRDPPAFCDPEQIYQVALNLLVNALQALPPGGTVRLATLAERGGMVGFEVSDDGPGLPEDLRGRIFQRFVTGRAGGTGLGLAFVERIVKAHRGSVSVRSKAGEGTVFEVRLPAAEGPA